MPLEYYNQNSFRKYPFKDSVSLMTGSGEALPNDCFVDAQVTAFNSVYTRAYLQRVASDTDTLELTVVLTNQAGNSSQSFDLTAQVSDLAEGVVVSGHDLSHGYVKLVFGGGMQIWAAEEQEATFNVDTAELAAGCVLPYSPQLHGLTVKTVETSTNDSSVVHTYTGGSNVVMQPGYNVNFTGEDRLKLSVEPGAGLGLFDDCSKFNVSSEKVSLTSLGVYAVTNVGAPQTVALGNREAGVYQINYVDGAYRWDADSWGAHNVKVVYNGGEVEVCPKTDHPSQTAVEHHFNFSPPYKVFVHGGGAITLSYSDPGGYSNHVLGAPGPRFELSSRTVLASYLQSVSPIRRVNTVEPTEHGNLLFATDACHTKQMGSGFVVFRHTCGRGCTSVDYRALAFYLNRLRNATSQMRDYSVVLKQAYDAAVEATAAKIEADKRYKAPYMKFDRAEVRSVKKDFINGTLAIHLPNKEKATGTMTVDLGSKMTLVDSTASLNLDNVQIARGSTLGFNTMMMACKRHLFQRFSLETPRLVNADQEYEDVMVEATDDDGYSLESNLVHDGGRAYYYTPYFHKHGWFDVSYNTVYTEANGGSYRVHFEVNLFDSENTTNAVTAFTMTLPNGFDIVQGSLKLWANETVMSIPAGDQRPPGWVDVELDFRKKNRLTFDAVWEGDPCTDTPVNNTAITLEPRLLVVTEDRASTFTHTFQVVFQPPE